MRLNGIDRRYANDQQYIIFLYQIKESLEIKRSRVTYFRKCKMNKTKYNKATLGALTKTEMERSDLGFKAFKNVRGTTPYFEAKKKDLFAMIGQIGPQVRRALELPRVLNSAVGALHPALHRNSA